MKIIRESIDLNLFADSTDCESYIPTGFCCYEADGRCCQSGNCCQGC